LKKTTSFLILIELLSAVQTIQQSDVKFRFQGRFTFEYTFGGNSTTLIFRLPACRQALI